MRFLWIHKLKWEDLLEALKSTWWFPSNWAFWDREFYLAEEILKIWVHMLSGMHKHPKKWAHTQTWQRQMYKDKKKTTFTSFNSIVCYLMIQHYQQKHIPFCPVVLEFPPALYQIILLLMESNKLIDWLEYLSIHIHKFTASASRGIPRCTCPLTYDF